MARWATILLFDDNERYDALVDWARAHDTMVCTVVDQGFVERLSTEIAYVLPPDRDELARNGGVIKLDLQFTD